MPKVDNLGKISKAVTPAKAGAHKWFSFLDSRFRGNDENRCFVPFCCFVEIRSFSHLGVIGVFTYLDIHPLSFIFTHSKFDVGRSMFDGYLFIRSTFISS